MRSLAQKVTIRPLSGKSKVVVLDEAHMITQPGWQAMLKPVEEPPPHVVFIILTTDPQKIKSTILDRCSRVTLQGISVEECTELLVKIAKDKGLGKAGLEKKHLTKIAKVSKGHTRKALHALEQVYTMVLDASDAGQTIDTAVVNTFIQQVAVTDVETLAAGVARSVLEGKTGGALKRAQDAWSEADPLLTHVTEIMRQAMFLSSNPKLMDRYFEDVLPECKIFQYTTPDNPLHIEARKVVLEAYACFTKIRIDTSNYTVPVAEVLGEAIARASLICQTFLKAQRKPKVKAVASPEAAEVESEPAEAPKNGTAKASSQTVRKKKRRVAGAKLPS
jgi:DNA polymerase III gamma/tau subunit